MNKEIKTELIRVSQEKYNETKAQEEYKKIMEQEKQDRIKAQEKAKEYSKMVARKNMWNNIGIAVALIVLIALVIVSGIIGSVELGAF